MRSVNSGLAPRLRGSPVGARAKHALFMTFGVMAVFVAWNNERFVLNSHAPEWEHLNPIRWRLLPHGVGGTLASGRRVHAAVAPDCSPAAAQQGAAPDGGWGVDNRPRVSVKRRYGWDLSNGRIPPCLTIESPFVARSFRGLRSSDPSGRRHRVLATVDAARSCRGTPAARRVAAPGED
jgi:hypothetical protein